LEASVTLVGFKAQNHRQQIGKRGALEKVDDRRTPRSLFDPLNDEFRFTLDVAASDENTLCPAYFTIADDGLSRRWFGSVWCNPPYSDCSAWVRKANYESQWCESVVMLLPANRTEQAWWQDFIEPYRGSQIETRFLRGRLRFDTPSHDYTKQPKGNRPPFGVVVVIWKNS
jgi:phage N-6-adenine-methyltransferase